jgi:hypothetical protein
MQIWTNALLIETILFLLVQLKKQWMFCEKNCDFIVILKIKVKFFKIKHCGAEIETSNYINYLTLLY